MTETVTVVGTFDVEAHWGTIRCKVARYETDRVLWYYPLTTCCDATGKGLYDEEAEEGYVGCRSCYEPVDGIYGTAWYSEDEWQAALVRRDVIPVG